MKDYYANQNVRARMVEFLGGTVLDEATCVYVITGRDAYTPDDFVPRPPTDLWACLNEGIDISRSLWDRKSLIADLDIEYVNFDFPAEAYLDPERVFEIQRPVEQTIERVLLDYGITPLHLLSGRGHHFVWRIRRDSLAFDWLAQLGQVSQGLRDIYANPPPPVPHGISGEAGGSEVVEPNLGAAFAGLGLVMEYIAHRVKKEAAPLCEVPVELTAVLVGPKAKGRELVSIDISEYGDPLNTRAIRIPFSLYLKPRRLRDALGDQTVDKIPPMFLIPLHEMDVQQGLLVMRDMIQTADLANRASVHIPDQSQPMERLVAAYAASALAKFHDWFYSQEHEPPEMWPQTYDQTPMKTLPLCMQYILEHPNDLLLHPSGIERVVHVMLALGWHPRHIAGLIRSRFERDYGWGERWTIYEPGTRADFYTRVFTGLFVAGLDELINFNCQSAKEAQFCFNPDCSCDLGQFRKSLIERRNHERLACRPFNRLFLPDEYL